MRFFTFPEIQTDAVSLLNPARSPDQIFEAEPGQRYLLAKDKYVENADGQVQRMWVDTDQKPNLLKVQYDIDPSISHIVDENIKLAKYLHERFLTIDIFDADSRFLYATCKVPLFELLRQQHPHVERSKECEISSADSKEFRGSIYLQMGNQGKTAHEIIKDPALVNYEIENKRRAQPSQHGTKKIVSSKPMDLTRI